MSRKWLPFKTVKFITCTGQKNRPIHYPKYMVVIIPLEALIQSPGDDDFLFNENSSKTFKLKCLLNLMLSIAYTQSNIYSVQRGRAAGPIQSSAPHETETVTDCRTNLSTDPFQKAR